MREAQVQRVIVQHFRSRGCMVIKMHPHPLGVPPGFPDLMILMPGGKVRFVEVKAEGGRTTALQEHTMAALKSLGHSAVVARSLLDALAPETT